MNLNSKGIEKLGFGNWLRESVEAVDLDRFSIARVTAVHKESYNINNGQRDVLAELTGKMLFSAASPVDFPTTGDWVLANLYDEETFSIIHKVLPRKSLLKRKTAGKKIDIQLIAANIDVAFIIQSLDVNFNLRRLERYLAMAKESHIEPIVLLSKSDLLSFTDIEDKVSQINAIMPALHVQPFSNENKSGLKQVTDLLIPGKTYCLLGSSGVGKTSLLNNLKGDLILATRAVREKDHKGRHTTTNRQLIQLDNGALLIDTPGMRELGSISVETGLNETFAEIIELSAQCRFSDCTHINEEGCAVLHAVKSGLIPEKRYQNYIKMKKESDYHDMSYLEKRKKDKQFGKMCKTVMKHKKNRK